MARPTDAGLRPCACGPRTSAGRRTGRRRRAAPGSRRADRRRDRGQELAHHPEHHDATLRAAQAGEPGHEPRLALASVSSSALPCHSSPTSTASASPSATRRQRQVLVLEQRRRPRRGSLARPSSMPTKTRVDLVGHLRLHLAHHVVPLVAGLDGLDQLVHLARDRPHARAEAVADVVRQVRDTVADDDAPLGAGAAEVLEAFGRALEVAQRTFDRATGRRASASRLRATVRTSAAMPADVALRSFFGVAPSPARPRWCPARRSAPGSDSTR